MIMRSNSEKMVVLYECLLCHPRNERLVDYEGVMMMGDDVDVDCRVLPRVLAPTLARCPTHITARSVSSVESTP